MDPSRIVTAEDIRTAAQARALGTPASALRAAVADGRLTRLWPACYIPTQLWEELPPQQRALAIHYAFHAKTGARITYSHTSAALAHGVSLLRVPQELHLAGDPKPGYRHRSLRTHRLPDVATHRVRTDLDLPAASLEQTALACARTLPMLDALVVLDQLAARHVDLTRLSQLLRTSSGTHGNRQALLAVAAADARAGSPAETLTRWRLREAGLPEPELQIEVRTTRGRSFLDLGWPGLRVAVEVDGRIKYTDCGPTQEVPIAEREREKRIQNTGWTLRRTGWHEQVRGPRDFLVELAHCLLAQQLRLGLPPLDLDRVRRRVARMQPIFPPR